AARHAAPPRLIIGPGIVVRQQYYEPRYDWQVTSVAAFAGALLVSGLVALSFWRGEGRDPVPFWFGVTALSWTLSAWLLLWPPATSNEALRDLLAFATRHLYATPLLVLCLRVGGRRMRALEAGLWSLFAIAGAASALDGIPYAAGISGAVSFVYLALIVGFLAWLLQLRRRDADCPCVLLSLALVTLVLFSGHDWARWMGYADFDGLLLAPFATPFLILALGANVVRRHAEARRAIERANRELEQRVAEKAREIEQTWRRVEQAQREQAVLRERQRIMADMHDGLGSGLVSLASIVQARNADLGEIERRLDDLLTELRATVDSLEPVEGDLGVVLGNIRYRMRSAIEASGARFLWKVEPLPPLDDLTPDRVLAVQRIVLEALANALRHAGASVVALSARGDDARREIVICVSDNGGGFDPTGSGHGRGLRSMRERAGKLGATLDIKSAPADGTEVTLRLNYPQAKSERSITDAH
ncbi:MAG: ATP-binding protein, partial [Pseudomonadota bacterium]